MRPLASALLATSLAGATVAGTAACGGNARPARATQPSVAPASSPTPRGRGPAAATAATAGNGELLAALGPTGATWEETLARVPPERARAVAIAFLRQGDFACRAILTEDVGCASTIEVFAPIAPDATLDDGCLRRLVAGWALDQLEATDVAAVADALAAIVALPHPEQALADAVVALVPPKDDRLRLRLVEAALAAQRDDVADQLLPGLTPGGAAHALVELDRDAALALLGDDASGAIAAALDNGLSYPAALDALNQLAVEHLADPEVLAAVIRQTTSDDCAVAARAVSLLDAAGDDQYLPSHGAPTDAASATRALCVAGHVSPDEAREVLRTLVSADGLDLVDVDHTYMDGPELPDPDLDGDHDPYTHTTRRHVVAASAAGDDILDALPTSCEDGACYGPTGTVTLTFGSGAGHAFSLDEIRVERADNGCGC
ncbi:MAG TPA: hypothetical protein VM261_34020 [Kofleriaceae bacterium]|nr:hypothetical protein [Kofleriaceae bacterium]